MADTLHRGGGVPAEKPWLTTIEAKIAGTKAETTPMTIARAATISAACQWIWIASPQGPIAAAAPRVRTNVTPIPSKPPSTAITIDSPSTSPMISRPASPRFPNCRLHRPTHHSQRPARWLDQGPQ